MGQVAESLAAVQERIVEACQRVGRDPREVRLLPVSKTHPVEVIREAYDAGIRVFGENKVQELVEKAETLQDRVDLQWAVIGHLQTNKAKAVAELASEFHALDSIKVADALDRRLQDAGRALDVFIQVNSSDENQKFGLPPAEVGAFAAGLKPFGSLRVRGLMTLAVYSDSDSEVRACFERMITLRTELQSLDRLPGSYDELSMGMSGDFELAIESGATTVRVGQAIFGARDSA